MFSIGRDNAISVHVTLVPFIKAAGEIKTKPTQHSVKMLLELGIQPDILICRSELSLSKEVKEKLRSLQMSNTILFLMRTMLDRFTKFHFNLRNKVSMMSFWKN